MGSKEASAEVVDEFRRILGIDPEAEVPQGILDCYINFRRMKEISSAGTVTPSEMILLTMIAPREEAIAVARELDIDYSGKGIKKGSQVTTKFEGKSVKGMLFEDPGGDYLHVKITGDDMNFQKVLRKDTKAR